MHIKNFFKTIGSTIYQLLGENGRNNLSKIIATITKSRLNYKTKMLTKKNVRVFVKTLKELTIKNDIQDINDHIMDNLPTIEEKDYISLNTCLNKIEEYLKTINIPNKIILITTLMRKLPTFYYRLGKIVSK